MKCISLKGIYMYYVYCFQFLPMSPTIEVMQIYFCMQKWDPN